MLVGVRLLRGRAPNVEKLQRKGDVDGLVRALRFEDPISDGDGRVTDLGTPVRVEATKALAGMEAQAAFGGLLNALDDPEEKVRIAAVRGLRQRGDPFAVEQLTSAVTNWTAPEHLRARDEAIDALAHLRDPTAPRRMAAGLLTRTAELDDVHDANALRRLTQAGGEEAMRGTIEDLVARLRNGDASPRTRPLLVWLAPESVDSLVAALDHPVARREAIIALGSMHNARAVEPLLSILLGDDEPPVRIAAAWALGEIRDPIAVDALLLATGDADFGVRSEAIQSFDKLGNAAIAFAMGTLIRPMLENGSAPQEAIEPTKEEEPAAVETGSLEETDSPDEAAETSAPTQVHERPPDPPRTSQTMSVVRRLLAGRYEWPPRQ
jgi:HEAT repeat protein